MPARRFLSLGLLTLLALTPLSAQQRDSIPQLPELGVRASRTDLAPGTAGLSITQLAGDSARRGRGSPSLEELLAFVPGVLARDRSDYSLDTRITMRGAGARANFGVRGIRVVIDGVPATLPDGQTPLTSLDLELTDRIEVARGPLAALHGNGSLGVVSISTPARFGHGFEWRVASELTVSNAALHRQSAALGFGGDRLGGMLSASYLDDGGLRQHSQARQLRMRGGLEWKPGKATTFTLRGNWAADRGVQAPGALTLAEFEADPTIASATSLLRNAGKEIDQQQVSLGVTHRLRNAVLDASAWLLWRDLENPLAAPAPAPALPSEGVWVGIDRAVRGARTTIRIPVGPRLLGSAGLDLQQMRDDRVNRRHDAGVASGTAFLDQREQISELGGFGQLIGFMGHGFTTRAGLRHDRVAFRVDDHRTGTSGDRVMAAWSVGGSLAWQRDDLQLWLGFGSAFETPTTTEMANRPDGDTGLNSELDPARTRSIELGLRAAQGAASVEVVLFNSATKHAITAIAESGGRSYFANVGETSSRGAELTTALRASDRIRLHATATTVRARFGSGATDATGASISDNRLPGVVPLTARVGATFQDGPFLLDLDHAWSGEVWADDGNTVAVPGWGSGVTNLLLRVSMPCDCVHFRLAARNLLDQDYASGVVVNGGFGRVVEPGSGRRLVMGVEAKM